MGFLLDGDYGILNPDNIAKAVTTATRFLRCVRPPSKIYDGVIDMYDLRITTMRPGHPDSVFSEVRPEAQDMPNSIFDGPWQSDHIFPNRDITMALKQTHVIPLFWNPVTDLFSTWLSHANTKCGHFEIQAMDCMEYYGFKKGKVICKDYYEDFTECRNKFVQLARIETMHYARQKRYYEAKRDGKDTKAVYEECPKMHAWPEPFWDPKSKAQ